MEYSLCIFLLVYIFQVPFLIGMFIFVYVLRIYGWISLFAHGLSKFINILAGTPQATFGSNLRMISASVFVMIFLSSIACNFMSNQPMVFPFLEINTLDNFFYIYHHRSRVCTPFRCDEVICSIWPHFRV